MSVVNLIKTFTDGLVFARNVVDIGEFVEFTNDHMFCSVMEDEAYCKEFLQRVLGFEIVELKYVTKQRHIRNRVLSRGIRLDVYVRDTENNTYAIEMQTTVEKYLAKRIRYYHSEMDGYEIRKGQDYKSLGKNIVIFVCTYDPFGDNRSIYTFRKKCDENSEIILNDGTLSVILNAQGKRDGINNKLKNLLDYIKTGEPTDDYTDGLSAKVREINADNDWRDRHMTLKMKMKSIQEDAREEGREEGRELLAQAILALRNGSTEEELLKQGFDVETIKLAMQIK